MAKPKRQRLDTLVSRIAGIDDLKTVQGLIMAGKVVVDGAVITKPGAQVSTEARIHVRERLLRFASRGGYKLERALDRFSTDVGGLVCLDAGASTGGFTDCLLQHNACRVYAVDVGYGQLRGRLATDSRVVNLERTNISDLSRSDLHPPIDFASVDLSYLTHRKSLPILVNLFVGEPHLVTLVKPLYEGLAQEDIVNRPAIEGVLLRLVEDLQVLGYPPADACVSPILGGRGAVEFFFHFTFKGTRRSPEQIVALALDDLDRNAPTDELSDPPTQASLAISRT
jgi:23S rRNA (cytidine1920-2'-O)/16S rRNA (cytidine1409-2'-O)-methyltransferase